MRLLLLAQESTPGDQVGPRQAVDSLLGRSFLSAAQVYSCQSQLRVLGAPAFVEDLYRVAAAFDPDIVVWQTVGRLPVTADLLRRLKALPRKPLLIYAEEDLWGRTLSKRLTRSMRRLTRAADLVCLHGLGDFAALFEKAGARSIHYFPNSVDTLRFGQPWNPAEPRRYDVVMIAGHYPPRLPFVPALPGTARRFELARKLGQRLGPRFALFGRGWPDWPFAKGPLPYPQQEKICRQAWLTVNWDHYDDVPFYFSDRLPIALLAGVPHVTNYHPGYEYFFGANPAILFGRTPDEVIDIVRFLLSKPPRELIDLGQQAADFARQHLLARDVFAAMIEKGADGFVSGAAHRPHTAAALSAPARNT